jgi:glycosyltransferase involved in cell wall biosynthesis
MAVDGGVSVIIPTFDRIAVLPRALDSVLAQTLAPAEVIVVDDGSGDGTAEMVRREYPGVTLMQQDNRGVSAARNAGLARAAGEWIAFLDSDDEWLPRKLERQIDALAPQQDGPQAPLPHETREPQHDGPQAPLPHETREPQQHRPQAPQQHEPDETRRFDVCHTDEIWIRNGRRVNPMRKHEKKGGWIFEHNLDMCRISPSSVLIHRDVFDAVGTFDEALPACEDYDLWLRITSRYPVRFLDERLVVKYGGHDDQLSRRYPGMDRFRVSSLEKILKSGHLDRAQARAAARALVEKVDIYLQGARKRGRHEEVVRFERKRSLWAEMSGD